MRGLTTAGLTAARTDPNKADSKYEILNIHGAIIVQAIISNVAGKKHKNIEGLPTFFNVLKLSDNPDLVKITTNAICLNSLDMFIILMSIKLDINIPDIIIPTSPGILIFSNNFDVINPNKSISAKLCNINLPPKNDF